MSDREALCGAGEDLVRQIGEAMARVDWDGFVALSRRLARARFTFVTGAGRSGLVARGFGMRLMHTGLQAYIPGETITPAAGPEDLLVAISCTGTTGYTDYMARRARELGASVAVITAEAGSPLARLGHQVLVIPVSAGSIVVRAAVFEHSASLCLDAVFNVLAEQLKLDTEAYQQRHANLQ
ncbi:MAG: SIS domain-containing protein [Candidatus Latescibacterota bacterium]